MLPDAFELGPKFCKLADNRWLKKIDALKSIGLQKAEFKGPNFETPNLWLSHDSQRFTKVPSYEVSEGHYHIPKKYRLPLEGVMGVGWVMADYGGLVDWVVGLKAHIIL